MEVNRTPIKSWKADSVDKYEKISLVGEGTFGKVWKARPRTDQMRQIHNRVALKQIKLQDRGFPLTTIRELTLLRRLNHPNVVKLLEVVNGAKSNGESAVYLVFEFIENDLENLIAEKRDFSVFEKKFILFSILNGVAFLHAKGIIHRDIKAENVLVEKNKIKLADFGLARTIERNTCFLTPKVASLWYRAPEVFLGTGRYTEKIDIWSFGC